MLKIEVMGKIDSDNLWAQMADAYVELTPCTELREVYINSGGGDKGQIFLKANYPVLNTIMIQLAWLFGAPAKVAVERVHYVLSEMKKAEKNGGYAVAYLNIEELAPVKEV